MYHWLHQAAHILANDGQHKQAVLKQEYEHLLTMMKQQQDQLGELATSVTHFCKVTASYWDGLFACYHVKDLPRTNNGLEQYFGSARHTERRVTGRKQGSKLSHWDIVSTNAHNLASLRLSHKLAQLRFGFMHVHQNHKSILA